MPLKDRARSVLATAGRRVPPGARNTAGRLSRRLRREFRGPLVSIVLAVSDDESTRIGPMLNDLRGSAHRNIDVVVVPYGRSREVTDLAREHADADWRIRVLKPAPDRAGARNRGAEAARGTYVGFVAGGDNYPPHAISTALAALERTGSDLAVSATAKVASASNTGDAVTRGGPRRRALATTLAATPAAILDLGIGNRLFRRDFWKRAGLRFEGDARRDGDVALRAFALARTFDLLDRPVYIPTGRKDGASVGTMHSVISGLAQFDEDQRRLSAEIARLGAPGAEDVWLAGVLDKSLQNLIDDVERADDEQWQALQSLAISLLDQAGEDVWPQLRATSKTKLWLLREGRRADLEDFIERRWFQRGASPTRVQGDQVIALLPYVDDPTLPPSCFQMAEHEVPLHVIVRRAAWAGDLIELDLLTRIDFVHLDQRPEVTVELVHVETGQRVPVELAPYDDQSAGEFDGRRFQDFTPGTFRVTVDPRQVVQAIDRSAEVNGFDLALTMTVPTADGEITRSGGITKVDDQSEAGLLEGEHTAPRVFDGYAVGVLRRGQVPELAGAGLISVGVLPAAAAHTRALGVRPTRSPGDLLEVDRFEFGEDAVTIHGRFPHGRTPGTTITMVSGGVVLPVNELDAPEGQWQGRWSLTHSPWADREVAIPQGRYVVTVRSTVGRGRSRIAPTAFEDHDHLGAKVRLIATCAPDGEAAVRVLPPIAARAAGPYGQERMRERALSTELAIDPRRVYLQAYQGQSATDSQLAIHHELRRSHPELELMWGVLDHSSWVPEGAQAVVMHSPEWYEALGSAGALVMNVDFERWFSPKPGQRVLQTFHGYPAKSMGIGMWEGKGYTPRRIALELARTSGDWDLILTPAPEMDEYYRREYRYDGAIHSQGYPRADGLVDQTAAARRAEVRTQLGIAAGQKAVLYAPTWRDDATTRWLTAEMVTHLDVNRASAALGDDYVLLMRGHRFHQLAHRPAGNARVLDVTTYPEINDLILAADAAILDYSSLRFDFGLTGKPMVFLVPDLAVYTADVRGFLYPFTESAPGPLRDTTEEVVADLRDLDALEARHRADLAAFNARFNYLMDGRAAERVVAEFFGPAQSTAG